MAVNKRYKIVISGSILLLCLVVGGVLLFALPRFGANSEKQQDKKYTACVLETSYDKLMPAKELTVYLVLSSDELTGQLSLGPIYEVNVSSAVIISHDSSIKAFTDIQPGVLLDITVKNLDVTRRLISPPPIPDMSTVTSIETSGKTDDTLFQTGVDNLSAYGFTYENGQIVRLSSDSNNTSLK